MVVIVPVKPPSLQSYEKYSQIDQFGDNHYYCIPQYKVGYYVEGPHRHQGLCIL